jgi:hypothetical protein
VMGAKGRGFGPLPPVTLADLGPPDHFYRHLERTLDLGFVRDLGRESYADIGRPAIDPVVFFKRQLILFGRPRMSLRGPGPDRVIDGRPGRRPPVIALLVVAAPLLLPPPRLPRRPPPPSPSGRPADAGCG